MPRSKCKKSHFFVIFVVFLLAIPIIQIRANYYHYVYIVQSTAKGTLSNFSYLQADDSASAKFTSITTNPFPPQSEVDIVLRFNTVEYGNDHFTLQFEITSMTSGITVNVMGGTSTNPTSIIGSFTSIGHKSIDITSRVSVGSNFYVRFQSLMPITGFDFYMDYLRINCEDTILPSFSADGFPPDAQYFSASPQLDWHVTDNYLLDEVYYDIDDTTPDRLVADNINAPSRYYTDWQIPIFADLIQGSHWLYFSVKDVDGGMRIYAGLHFYKDVTPPSSPTITSSSHTQGVWSTNNDPSFTISGSSDTSGIYGYSYSWSTPDLTAELLGPGPHTIDLTNIADGEHTFSVVALDNANPHLQSFVSTFVIRIDSTAPAAATPDDGISGWSPYTNPTLTWPAITDTSGVTYYYEVGDSTPDAHTTLSTFVLLGSLSDGVHTFYLQVRNGAGLSSSVRSHIMYIDATMPNIPDPDDYVDGWSTDDTPTFSWPAITDTSGIQGYWWSVDDSTPYPDGTFTTSTSVTVPSQSDGGHYFYVVTANGAGLLSGIGYHQFGIDVTPPGSPNPDDGVTGWTNNNTLTFDWEAISDYGIKYWYAIDDPTPQTGGTWTYDNSVSLSSLPEGTHTFYVVTENGAGLFSSVGSHSFSIDTSESNSPIPDDGIEGWSSDDTPTFNWSAVTDTSGIQGYWYSIDNPNPEIGGAFTTETAITLSSQFDGTHTFYIRALNGAGDLSSGSSHVFYIDATFPDSPLPDDGLEGTTNNNTPTFSWNPITDDSAILGYWYAIDDASPESGGTWIETNTVTLSPQTDGVHSFFIVAQNGAGLYSDVSSHSFSIDTTPPPSPILVSPTNGKKQITNDPTFTWNLATDAVEYEIEISTSNSFTTIQITYSSLNTFYISSSLPDNLYYWHVRAVDEIGNWGSWSNVFTFTIDTTIPTCSHPDDQSFELDKQDQFLEWALDDNLASGYYRVLIEDIVFIDWTSWTLGVNVSVPVDTSILGEFTYTLEFNDSLGHVGLSDEVKITISEAIITTTPTETSEITTEVSSETSSSNPTTNSLTTSPNLQTTSFISTLFVLFVFLAILFIRRRK